jgi:hypothetical protein
MDDNVAAYRAEKHAAASGKSCAHLWACMPLWATTILFGHEREIAEELTRAGIKVLANESLMVDGLLFGRPQTMT